MKPRSGCAINAAVEVLGDHWSFLVLRDVILGDPRYFRELLNESIDGIPTKVDAVRGQRARLLGQTILAWLHLPSWHVAASCLI
jgi:hypothetical protein